MILKNMQELYNHYYMAPDRNSANSYIEWLEEKGGKTADDYGYDSVVFTDEDLTAFVLKFGL